MVEEKQKFCKHEYRYLRDSDKGMVFYCVNCLVLIVITQHFPAIQTYNFDESMKKVYNEMVRDDSYEES